MRIYQFWTILIVMYLSYFVLQWLTLKYPFPFKSSVDFFKFNVEKHLGSQFLLFYRIDFKSLFFFFFFQGCLREKQLHRLNHAFIEIQKESYDNLSPWSQSRYLGLRLCQLVCWIFFPSAHLFSLFYLSICEQVIAPHSFCTLSVSLDCFLMSVIMQEGDIFFI